VGTPPLHKNGRDQHQDQALRDISVRLGKNDEAHDEIFDFLKNSRNDDKWKGRIVAVGWTVLMAVVGALTLWMQSNERRLDGIDSRISHVESEEQSNAARGFGLADHLRKDIDKNEDNLRELQRLHRIKPDDRRRIGPAEE
jgi:hypothetical protein